MVLKSDKIRLRKMLSDSIIVLCRAGLPFQSKVQVEALIGITLDDGEVVLLSLKETMSSSGLMLSSDSANDDETDGKHNFVTDGDQKCNPASVTIKDEYPDVEWDAADTYKRPKRRRRSAGAQKFGDFQGGGERADASPSAEQDELFANTSTEMDGNGQPVGVDYDHFGGGLVNDNRLDQNFPGEGNTGYRARMKVEASDTFDDNGDDCMIVKSEEPALTECYEIDDNQAWDGQHDMFDGNNFHGLQGVGVPGDVMAATYDQDPNWLPQLSKPPAKKFKMPLQPRRQSWMGRPSSTKARISQPTGKLHSKPSPRPVNNEVTCSWTDENRSVDEQRLTCKYCGIQLNTERSLREHVKGVHLKLNSYTCEFCHETFKWRMGLSRHRRNFHKLFVKSNVKFEN